jgi:hypothetical protein
MQENVLEMATGNNATEALARLASLDVEELRSLSAKLEDAQQAIKSLIRSKLNRMRSRQLAPASAG